MRVSSWGSEAILCWWDVRFFYLALGEIDDHGEEILRKNGPGTRGVENVEPLPHVGLEGLGAEELLNFRRALHREDLAFAVTLFAA